jgi:3-oxoacyl-[acyl-carrier-protein] synthase II
MKNRVVVTGMGVVSPIGIGWKDFWKSLVSGKSGIRRVTRFDVSDFSCKIGGEIDGFDPLLYMDKKEVKRTDRFVQYALAASMIAVEDGGLNMEAIDRERAGVLIGSGIGGIETFENQCKILHKQGPKRVSSLLIPSMIINMASGQVAIQCGFSGPNSSTVTACASGTHAVGEAFRLIQHGYADLMITGGTEAAITPIAFAGFCSAKAMSTRDVRPEEAMCPFDNRRDGFVMGDGAGVVILESLEHALRRNANIYAEIIGFGTSCDAYHITAPHPDAVGAIKAIREALNDGGLSTNDVDYINAHGTSTKFNDMVETAAIKSVFGERAYDIPVSSSKSMIGHLLGAAGGVELVACCLAIKDGIIPPTINYEQVDPLCDLDYVPGEARKADVNVVMSNSFGFGGHNAVIVARKYR